MDNMLLTGCQSIKIENCASDQTGSGVDVMDTCLQLDTGDGSNCTGTIFFLNIKSFDCISF